MWAALILGHQRDKRAVPYLLVLLRDPEEHVRANAVLALSMLEDGTIRNAIAELQNDPSLDVQSAIRQTFGPSISE